MSVIRQLTITALGHRGEGIAEPEGGKVFVPHVLAGEIANVEISGNRGRVVDIVRQSEDRAVPFCPHFGLCGGCQLQHMRQDAYRLFKRDLVVSALERAGISAAIAPLVDATGAGRRRITLHATADGAGYMGLRSHDIHAIDFCPILVPALASAPSIARELAVLLGPCDVAFTAAENGLDVAVKAKGIRSAPRLAALGADHDLARLSINAEPVYSVRAPTITIGQAEVKLPIAGFLQATSAAEQQLAMLVLDAAKGFKSIADLFCGIGPFALRLAANGPVYAADSDASASAALESAVRSTPRLKPVTAERRDLFREPMTRFELNRFDCVVIDPPRAGARAQIGELAQAKVGRIVYVSCEPQSFARDAAVLHERGYRIGVVTPVDQFAWSTHVELVAVFDRGPAKR